MKQATIWMLVTNGQPEGGSMQRYFFFATKREAEKAFRERDAPDDLDDITPLRFPTTGKGLAEALDWFVNMTCLNEG